MSTPKIAHLQRMLQHQESLAADPPTPDPRDPEVQAPADLDPLYRQSRLFRQQMSASAHMHTLTYMIGYVHAIYEGWPSPHAPCRTHARAAEIAVRYCSPEARGAAMTAAENYAVESRERIDRELRSPDLTETQREAVIAREARFGIEVFLFHLLHEGGRSSHEWRNFEDAEARIALEMGGE